MASQKEDVFELATEYVCPGKVAAFNSIGIDLVIGKREGPYIYDLDGRQLIDCHINGGTFNLGHRNPEIIASLQAALETLDIGNHHFASVARSTLAEKFAQLTPDNLKYTVYSSGGGEAVDIAIKSARHATQRRAVIAIEQGYHGRTGLSGAAGDDESARFFLSEGPTRDFIKVPFNDLEPMEKALREHKVAAVIMETIPATSGFPMPADGYLPGVKALCDEHGALYIADEVQTGLGRTGTLWAIEGYGVKPDILVTAKGLSGGIYPMAATVLNEQAGGWLMENPFAHPSTFGGSELGCHVAMKVLDLCSRPEALENAKRMSEYFGRGLEELKTKYPGLLVEIRRNGLVMGLKFEGEMGALPVMKSLFDHGVWAIVAGFDMSVLQFKPILTVDEALADETLARMDKAFAACAAGASA